MSADPSLLPLSGTRVLDLTQSVAGPFATQILADLGADVLKVEKSVGDDTRTWGPPFWQGESAVFLSLNRNKRTLTLDIGDAAARPILEDLVREAHVLVESLKPSTLERLGFDQKWAAALNPRLHYCRISAFGARGPLSGLPGYDPLMQAYAGIMSVTGHPGQVPVRVGVSLIDMATGMWAAMSVLAAMVADPDRSGPGRLLDVSLYESALSWMSYHLVGYWADGTVPEPQGGGTAFLCPYGPFETNDGHVVVAAGNDALFARLCDVLDLTLDPTDPRYATNRERVARRVEVDQAVASATGGLSSTQLVARLEAGGIPCAPVQPVDEVAEQAQAQALDMFQLTSHESIENLRLVGLPISFDGTRPGPRLGPPLQGPATPETPSSWSDATTQPTDRPGGQP